MEGSIDFYATPNVRLPPDDHFIEQDFPSFGTSYARQDVSTAQEGRNQRDHYDPHFASLVTTPISCLKDDEDFVSRDGQLSRGRPTYLWLVVYRFCGQNYDLAVQTWLKLLEGGTGDDIWLWVDGDEEVISIENYQLLRRENTPMPTPTEWRNAASALSRRLERIRVGGSQDREEPVHLAETRHRVQEAGSRVRLPMISWIVASSKAMRDADASRGLNHRERWDLQCLISNWTHTVQSCWFPAATVNDVFQTFDDAMKRAGHTCHDGYRHGLKEWIWMRSLLIPDQRYKVVYLSLTIESPCKACAARTRSLSPSFLPSHNTSASGESVDPSGVADNSHYQPPHYLVFLWISWSKLNIRNPTRFSRWVSILKSVDLWLGKFSSGTRHGLWLPWVAFYPDSWRSYCTRLSSHDWERAQTRIQSAAATGTQEVEQSSTSDIHDLPTSMDIGTWIGAIVLSILKHSKRHSKPSQKVWEFMWAVNNLQVDELLESIPVPEVEPTKAVTNFRRASRESHHTCYEQYSPVTLDWYASAMSLTSGTDDIKFIPLEEDEYSCASCRMAKIFRSLVKKVSTSTKHQLVIQELSAIAAQEGLRFESLTDDSRLKGPSSPMEDNPGESDDANGDNMHTSDAFHSASAMLGDLGDQRQSRATETSPDSENTRNVGVFHVPRAPRRPKAFMIKEIKVYFIKLLEDLEVPILGLKNKQLPWTTLPRVLANCGWELDNWPSGVPLPGSGDQSCDDNKGINGLDMKHINLLYDAMKSETCPLGFRRIIDTTSLTTGVSQPSEGSALVMEGGSQDCTPVASNEGSRESTAVPCDTSRKRFHDGHDVSDIERGLGKRQRMLERDF